FSGGFISDVPQTRNNARSSCIHKAPNDRHDAFTFDLFAERRSASAEHHEISSQFQVIDIVSREKSILWVALLINQRQHYARQLRVFAFDQCVCCKMPYPVAPDLGARRSRPIRLEVKGRKSAIVGQVKYCLCFLPCESQSLQAAASLTDRPDNL